MQRPLKERLDRADLRALRIDRRTAAIARLSPWVVERRAPAVAAFAMFVPVLAYSAAAEACGRASVAKRLANPLADNTYRRLLDPHHPQADVATHVICQCGQPALTVPR